MSLLSLLVWRTRVGIRTGQWWMYRIQSGNTEGIRGLGCEEGYDYINSHRDTGVYQVSGQEEREHKEAYKYRTYHKTYT